MKRLFVFGCSYTYYSFPTWADIIAYDTGLEYYNYGKPGLGNVGIQCRFLEAKLKHNITKDDLVIVSWTSWCREDRYINNDWKAHGNIMTAKEYDNNWIANYWSEENDIIKNSTAILTMLDAYKDLISLQINGPTTEDIYEDNKLMDFYSPHLPKGLPTIPADTPYDNLKDGHPGIIDYLKFVDKEVYPLLGMTMKKNTYKTMKNLDTKLRSLTPWHNLDRLWRKSDYGLPKVEFSI